VWSASCALLCSVRIAKVQKEYDTFAQDKAELLRSEKEALEHRLAADRVSKVAEMRIRIEKMWQGRIKRELDVRHGCCVAAPWLRCDGLSGASLLCSFAETLGRSSRCSRKTRRTFVTTQSSASVASISAKVSRSTLQRCVRCSCGRGSRPERWLCDNGSLSIVVVHRCVLRRWTCSRSIRTT
jgi:hypothetical protein